MWPTSKSYSSRGTKANSQNLFYKSKDVSDSLWYQDPSSQSTPGLHISNPRHKKNSSLSRRYNSSSSSDSPPSGEQPTLNQQNLPSVDENDDKEGAQSSFRSRTGRTDKTRRTNLPLASKGSVQELSTKTKVGDSSRYIPKPEIKGKHKANGGNSTDTPNPKMQIKGSENERKPQLRFSPSPAIKKPSSLGHVATASSYTDTQSLRRTAISNFSNKKATTKIPSKLRITSHGRKVLLKTKFPTPPIKSLDSNTVTNSRYSKIPVPQELDSSPAFQKATRSGVSSSGESTVLNGDENDQSITANVESPLDSRMHSPFQGASPATIDSSPDNIPIYGSHESWQPLISPVIHKEPLTEYKIKILNAFGYRGELFDGEKEFIKDLPKLIQRLDTKNYSSILSSSDIKDVKIREIQERIGIVKVLLNVSKFNKAPENESLCIRGWEDDFVKELEQIQSGECRPHKAWIRHIVDWLWGSIDGINDSIFNKEEPLSDDLFVLNSSSPVREVAAHRDKKEHELFNLSDTGSELIRQGLGGNEKKIVCLWADIREAQYILSACGRAVIDQYMRRLTRYDGVELPNEKMQERRMRYFCLRHYVHWKAAVCNYALALKMMNLLIVFHDLWGMHIDGMNFQEKKDWSILHDNLYDFAKEFERPAEDGEDDTWNKNECFRMPAHCHCFVQTAYKLVEKETRDKSLWFWILQMAAVAGYGKYHAALLHIMTEGKGTEYCNEMLDSDYWIRQSSMLQGLKRIQCAARKDARVGCLISPLGTLNLNVKPVVA
ncbi:hypothetical protein EDC01DRAFT_626762 [Geopyxis carbonaria]|nr:hypothetical protein EDC01DRAFT_626762 [Geopyxis carbonaria]